MNGGGDLENKKSELSGKFRVRGIDSEADNGGGGDDVPNALPIPLPDPCRLDMMLLLRFSGSDM